jgi:hypothetical protein
MWGGWQLEVDMGVETWIILSKRYLGKTVKTKLD